ncbi:MAG TPA: glycosyltransferase family 2 protein [Petrimonas sp.]|nr:glycosyltransferase family 2 protein [Petrimonas sp.]
MEKTVFFSVIIPLYNKAGYIERAILSVLNQTYPNFEIVVVNDGSTDNGKEIVKKLSDKRIKLINQPNGGVSSARNNGVKHASYDFVTFLDADDEWCTTFLERICNLIYRFPDSGIYATNNYFVYPDGQEKYENYDQLFTKSAIGILENYFKVFADRGKSPFSNSNFCMSKQKFLGYGGYKVGVKLTEDSDLWCRVAINEKTAFDVRPSSIYYLSTGNSTNSLFVKQEYEVIKTLKAILIQKSPDKPIASSIKKLIAFQRLSYVKRAIITGNKKHVFTNIFLDKIYMYYPVEFLTTFLTLFVPDALLRYIRNRRNND